MGSTALGKLIAELLIAISALSDYPVPAEQPSVEFVSHAVLEQKACGEPCQILAWFPPGMTIFMDDRLDPVGNVAARGILVHELVHYLQQEAGTFSGEEACQTWTEREREAFDIQFRWLTQQRAPLSAFSPNGKVPLRLVCNEDPQTPKG